MNKLARSVFKFNPLTHQNKYNLYLHEYQAYDLLKQYNVPLVPVIFLLFRASEPALQMMHMPSLIDSCHKPQSPNHLLISSLKLKFMLEEEEREHLEKQDSRVVFKLQQNHQKFLIMLRECLEKLWSHLKQENKARKSMKSFWLRKHF